MFDVDDGYMKELSEVILNARLTIFEIEVVKVMTNPLSVDKAKLRSLMIATQERVRERGMDITGAAEGVRDAYRAALRV